MPSSPLGSTHGRTMLGVTCHHRLWTAHSVERHRAWHDITALGQHTRSAHTVGLVQQRRAWHDITALGYYTQTDYVKRGMTSPP